MFDQSLKASTVHSAYGLQTAELPWNKVVARSPTMNHCMSKILLTDTLIWDEASLSSARTLQIVNAIHQALALKAKKDVGKPFGGKQVVLVGDFLQLRPVPNLFDTGRFLFEAEIFKVSFPHRYELLSLRGQLKGSSAFLKALKDLRVGQCSEESENLLSLLRRPLDEDLENVATHIYFRKIPVQLHNMRKLQELPGEMLSFDSQDRGR